MYNYKEAPLAHVHCPLVFLWSWHCYTVLGETGDPAELFRLETYDDESLLSHVGKASVKMLGMPDPAEWSELGDSTPPNWDRESESSFFCSLW